MPWTTADLPDLTGRTAVVTGANSGIGFATARELARAGASVVLACRSEQRAAEAIAAMQRQAPGIEVSFLPLDLADLASVRAFADEYSRTRGTLDLLVNNAGVMALPRRETADGFEMQLGTNHLGHFALTGLLLPALLATPAPRVTTVSSTAHKIGRMHFDDLQGERRYSRWVAYGQAKLANLLFAYELQRRADAAGVPLTSTAAHPGYAATNLQTASAKMTGNTIEEKVNLLANRVLAQDQDAGALPTLYAATGRVPGGSFVGPDGFMEMRGSPVLVGSTTRSRNLADATQLWTVSEELTGVRYDFAVPAAA